MKEEAKGLMRGETGINSCVPGTQHDISTTDVTPTRGTQVLETQKPDWALQRGGGLIHDSMFGAFSASWSYRGATGGRGTFLEQKHMWDCWTTWHQSSKMTRPALLCDHMENISSAT